MDEEAFCRVFARRKEFQMGAKFSTWLWRIALNLCYDELRRAWRQARHLRPGSGEDACGEPAPAGVEEETPYLRAVRNEGRELVRRALARLDENLKAAVVLRYCEGLKLREIAEVEEAPIPTIQPAPSGLRVAAS